MKVVGFPALKFCAFACAAAIAGLLFPFLLVLHFLLFNFFSPLLCMLTHNKSSNNILFNPPTVFNLAFQITPTFAK
jgi:hypothetical protein